MQYLTFEEYKSMGGTLEETAFNRNIIRVFSEVDGRTKRRIRKMATIPNEVKALCVDLVEYYSFNKSVGAVVSSKSVSAGPVSESESYAVKSSEDAMFDIEDLFNTYLGSVADDNGVPLLYRGCSF